MSIQQLFPLAPCQQLPGWAELTRLAAQPGIPTHQLFAQEPQRLAQLWVEQGGLVLDVSRQSFSLEAWQALCNFARQRHIDECMAAWMRGDRVNTSEDRAALHQVYRHVSPLCESWPEHMRAENQRMCAVADKIQRGEWKTSSGKPIECLINIGIGGSCLGVAACYQALAPHRHGRLRCLFLANIDPQAAQLALRGLDLTSCAVVVSSKSATTLETLSNFHLVKQAFAGQRLDITPQLFGVSAAPSRLVELGIPASQVFALDESVGGRYSLWSPIGFALACCVQPEALEQMRAGAAMLDRHTLEAPCEANMPVMLALASLWQHGLCGVQQHAILAYSHALRSVVDHLQQLVMESNGKQVAQNGKVVTAGTGEIVWGGENSNGQHSYFQLLHQGNQPLHCDLILSASAYGEPGAHRQLQAMALGQAMALADGLPDANPQCATPGNRALSTILCQCIDPYHLGALLALYENRTIAQAFLLGINPFDQWGVEFGKASAKALLPLVATANQVDTAQLDPSTRALLARLHQWRD